ncbi:MAG: hypothetical protein L3J91_06640 [Thermoplasmata archaeon]|nr:hypothetical protein [Thermoplasmata archaeon]
MAGTPPQGSPTAPPPPNPPLWMPAGSSPPSMMAHRSMMPNLSFLFRVLGFTLLFLGALIATAFATPGGACYTAPPSGATVPNCGPGTSYETGAANAIVGAHILFALGAFLLGAGAGLKLHLNLQANPNAEKEATRFVIADRWFNGVVLLVSIWILWSLMAGAVVAGF